MTTAPKGPRLRSGRKFGGTWRYGILLTLLLILSASLPCVAQPSIRKTAPGEAAERWQFGERLPEPSLSDAPASIKWLAGALLLALLYLGAYYGAPTSKKIASDRVPLGPTHNIKIARNLLAGVVGFVAVDAAIFHSGLYPSILLPNSFAGRVRIETQLEKKRHPSGAREILVVGDSRIAEAFSAKLADERLGEDGFKFIDLTIAMSSPRIWYYLMREVDPEAGRYHAVVIPISYEETDNWRNDAERAYDIVVTAPILRYTDAFQFAGSFKRWRNQFRAFAACVLRGYAFQSDFFDLLKHPIERMRKVRRKNEIPGIKYARPGREGSVVGIARDTTTNTVVLPEGFTSFQQQSIKESVRPPPANRGQFAAYRKQWLDRILAHYAKSSTTVIFFRPPRGPLGPPAGSGQNEEQSMHQFVRNERIILMPANTFDFLEEPQYFYDGIHPNSSGRRKFTEKFTDELLQRLPAANNTRKSAPNQ